MDRRFRSSDWFIVMGGLLVLVGSLLPWWTLSFGGALDVSPNGYDFSMTGRVPIVILLAVAIVTVVVKTESLPLPDWPIHPYAVAAAVVVAAIGIGVRFFGSGYDGTDNVSRGLGLYIVAAGVIGELVGAGLAIRDLRHPRVDVADEGADDDDLDLDDGLDDEADDFEEEEDDLVRRFNTSLPTGEIPVQRPANPTPAPRRTPTTRQPSPRRRPPRDPATPPTPRTRRRPSGPPLP